VALRVEDVLEGDWMKWHKGFLQKIIYYSITNILWRKGLGLSIMQQQRGHCGWLFGISTWRRVDLGT